MNNSKIYSDIATRTGGDVYIGVVGPVRCGKSTFIKKFMETLVLPQIDNEAERSRARDEMPQSADGKTVMTTEPKFVPEKAVRIALPGNVNLNVKMIDCVGYIVKGAEGLTENGNDRMVMTPWSKSPLPFEEAAEIGTKKVIDEHSTVGVMITTDGSIGDLPREAYDISEGRVIADLKACGKPFVVVMNSASPDSDEAIELALEIENKYSVPVALVNCAQMTVDDIEHILELCLFEFPVTELSFKLPSWIDAIDKKSPLRADIEAAVREAAESINTIASVHQCVEALSKADGISESFVSSTELATGKSRAEIKIDDRLLYKALSEKCNIDINNEKELFEAISELGEAKVRFDKIREALDAAESTGYGIVLPSVEDLVLEEPEIIKQSGGYGVKLKACADSLHMIRAKIQTEINPIVGSEKQSEEMVKFLLKEFEENPRELWESNMFGKSLYCLVNEGLNSKLDHIPQDARMKICQTLQKIVNEGSNGLICIIL